VQVPAPFEYERATSVDQAIGLLERLGSSARLVAGGHSLLPMMKLRLANFEYLIDINDLHAELGYIRLSDDEVRIGAMTRHRELLESDVLAGVFPIFRDAEKVIADPIVRNRGTLGGSLCQADPSEDLSAVCTTLDASCVIRGPGGSERVVTMEEFHVGPYETAVADNEILTEIRLPRKNFKVGSAYANVDARVGLAAVGPNTTGIPEISAALRGHEPDESLYELAGAIAARSCDPATDTRGSADYKRHLADELTRRTLRKAVERARS
jgi:carbon-monoxide dehydrogenase medium subunit